MHLYARLVPFKHTNMKSRNILPQNTVQIWFWSQCVQKWYIGKRWSQIGPPKEVSSWLSYSIAYIMTTTSMPYPLSFIKFYYRTRTLFVSVFSAWRGIYYMGWCEKLYTYIFIIWKIVILLYILLAINLSHLFNFVGFSNRFWEWKNNLSNRVS